jgi:hypothetical protein
MNKQVSYVNLVPAFENEAGYFAFQGSVSVDYKFKAWNVMAQWEPEFYGSPTEEALSGKKRGNFRGYRLKVSIMLDNTLEANAVKNLFNKFSGGFDRLVWQTIFSVNFTSQFSFQLGGSYPSANDWLNGTTASGFNGSPSTAIVSDYTSAGLVSVGASVSGSDANFVYFYAKPNVETIVLFDITGTATAYNDAALIPCNIINNNYGASRESTINKQKVGLELESIELFKEIPSVYLIS